MQVLLRFILAAYRMTRRTCEAPVKSIYSTQSIKSNRRSLGIRHPAAAAATAAATAATPANHRSARAHARRSAAARVGLDGADLLHALAEEDDVVLEEAAARVEHGGGDEREEREARVGALLRGLGDFVEGDAPPRVRIAPQDVDFGRVLCVSRVCVFGCA